MNDWAAQNNYIKQYCIPKLWSFVTIWVIEICHNLSFLFISLLSSKTFCVKKSFFYEKKEAIQNKFSGERFFVVKKFFFFNWKKLKKKIFWWNKCFGHYCPYCHDCRYCHYCCYCHYCHFCHYCHICG